MSRGSLIVRLVGDSEFPEFPVSQDVGLSVVETVTNGSQRRQHAVQFTDMHGAETSFVLAHVAWARYEPDVDEDPVDAVIDVDAVEE